MEMLYDDIRTLKACSLTCKSMFASTRHLIHQTLYLTPRNSRKVLTREEKSRYRGQGRPDLELCFLSHMGQRGFLQYTRQVHIRGFHPFTPDILLPHLLHFQSLDRVHTLTVDQYDSDSWATLYKSCFVHLYPTLTSLTLRRPSGHHRLVLQFVLQFPNLENLCLEWPKSDRTQQGANVPATIDQFPPLRGHLRLVGLGGALPWPRGFARELRKGVNFRSVEIEESSAGYAQDILGACAGTVESLAFILHSFGARQLSFLSCHGGMTDQPSHRTTVAKRPKIHTARASPSIDYPCHVYPRVWHPVPVSPDFNHHFSCLLRVGA